jgi:ubiquitin-protein ligase
VDIELKDNNILRWKGLLVPCQPPYKKGAFEFSIEFPENYPFRPPKLAFLTPIKHPNIDENGTICIPILKDENWRPTIKVLDGTFKFYYYWVFFNQHISVVT